MQGFSENTCSRLFVFRCLETDDTTVGFGHLPVGFDEFRKDGANFAKISFETIHPFIRLNLAVSQVKDDIGYGYLVVRNIFFGCEVVMCVFCGCHRKYDTGVSVLLAILHHYTREKCLIGLLLC